MGSEQGAVGRIVVCEHSVLPTRYDCEQKLGGFITFAPWRGRRFIYKLIPKSSALL